MTLALAEIEELYENIWEVIEPSLCRSGRMPALQALLRTAAVLGIARPDQDLEEMLHIALANYCAQERMKLKKQNGMRAS